MCGKDVALFALERGVEGVDPIKDIGDIGQHSKPVHVCQMFCQWGVHLGEEEEDFFAQIAQPGEDFAPGQPPDLGVKEQLLK